MLSYTCISFGLALVSISSRIALAHVHSNDLNATDSCVQLYENGVEAYLENRFSDCVSDFDQALTKYRAYSKTLQSCRIACKEEAALSDPLYPVNIENLLFYEQTIRNTLCIVKCKNDNKLVFGQYYINPEAEKLFQERKPYEYLHLCYFQTKQLEKAASAAFTYLVAHPDDKNMLSSLKHYSELGNVDKKNILNYEAKDYVYLYINGADAYEKEDWKDVIDNMEESLVSYLEAENECRAQCEGPFDQGWYPDFIPSISNHFTFVLKCKQGCKSRLNSLNGEVYEDLLPSHYHYLQFAYYKMGKLGAACRAVASYLMFYADDETMLDNMKFYQKLPKVQDTFFTPYDEAIQYVQREIYENKLLRFINTEFNLLDESINDKDLIRSNKIRVVMSEKQLHGPKRFVSDGLASVRECRSLVHIAKMFAILGDGYNGNKSPHTLLEKLHGFTLNRATLLVYFGLIHAKYLKLYLKLTSIIRDAVVRYFQTKDKLYFSYTQLVCRSALSDLNRNRTDFSHEVHADNCNIQKNGDCFQKPPAFTWRAYSAILYLNDDFDGGEFIFSEDPKAKRIQSVVNPKCGRMVAFSSGVENLHGVKAVKKGTRCAIGIWFTHDAKHAENDRTLAYHLLDNNISLKVDNPF